MKIKDVKDWITKNKDKIIYSNGLEDWDITIDVKHVHKQDLKSKDKSVIQAEVSTKLFEYKSAKIWFYSKNIDSEKELKKVLQHELFHIILSPYDMYLRNLATEFKLSKFETNYLFSVYEMAVTALEKRDSRS